MNDLVYGAIESFESVFKARERAKKGGYNRKDGFDKKARRRHAGLARDAIGRLWRSEKKEKKKRLRNSSVPARALE